MSDLDRVGLFLRFGAPGQAGFGPSPFHLVALLSRTEQRCDSIAVFTDIPRSVWIAPLSAQFLPCTGIAVTSRRVPPPQTSHLTSTTRQDNVQLHISDRVQLTESAQVLSCVCPRAARIAASHTAQERRSVDDARGDVILQVIVKKE